MFAVLWTISHLDECFLPAPSFLFLWFPLLSRLRFSLVIRSVVCGPGAAASLGSLLEWRITGPTLRFVGIPGTVKFGTYHPVSALISSFLPLTSSQSFSSPSHPASLPFLHSLFSLIVSSLPLLFASCSFFLFLISFGLFPKYFYSFLSVSS